jgi:hypothetical protein
MSEKELKSEKDVKAEIKKLLELNKCWYFMPVQTGYGVQGIPDFIVSHRGFFLGIEAKFGKNTESKWQMKQGEGILNSGGIYVVVNEGTLGKLGVMLSQIRGLEAFRG